ncbi:hypothetical protein IAU60_004612 [Kwoniella sp. DSM 27419]
MILRRVLPVLTLIGRAMAGMFSSSDATDSAGSSSSSSGSSASTSSSSTSSRGASRVNSPEVDFLLTLQAAQVSSMSCLITLVNMTTAPIGSCLGLTDLASLVSRPSGETSFSKQLDTYLQDVCSKSCGDDDIQEARAAMAASCDGSNGLVGVLSQILDKYNSSYKTVACQVHFNGTAENCLPATLNTSQTANTNDFFDSLVTGTNLDKFKDSVFTSAKCTGCMHEMFKAAQYTIPDIRGKDLTNAFGNHLVNDCPHDPSSPEGVKWDNTMDQQIPDTLQVSQNSNPGGSRTSSGMRVTEGATYRLPALVGIVIAAALLRS